MRPLFIILTFCIWAISCEQVTQNKDRLKTVEPPIKSNAVKNEQTAIDTFRIGKLIANKVMAYKFTTATIYVDYDDYSKSIEVVWKRYKTRMSEMKKASGEYVDHMDELRWNVIDSAYQAIRKLSKEADTIHLSHMAFKKVGLRPLMDFGVAVEKGNCVIYDDNGVSQTIIIRQKVSLSIWGGRRYFFPGASTYFYQTTDWIS